MVIIICLMEEKVIRQNLPSVQQSIRSCPAYLARQLLTRGGETADKMFMLLD